MKLGQKISALLVLTIFVLSVLPAGLADEGNDSDENEVENGSEMEVEVKDDNEKTEVKVREKVKAEVKGLKRELKEVRKEAKNAKERYEKAKENFKEAREKQQEHREKVLELNAKVKRCKEDEDCTLLKADLRLGIKTHLEKTVQVVTRALEKLQNKVEGMEDLSDEEEEHALSLISELEVGLETIKLKIAGFTNETPQEEVRATIKELKELTQKVNKLQRRIVGLLVNAKLQVLVEKHLALHEAMQARIDFLAEQGADVTALEAILVEFDLKVEELQADFEIAQEMWMNIDTTEDFDQFNRELRQAQHEVREDLKETRKLLREFVKTYKDIAGNLKEENETEEETPENETAEQPENESEETPEVPVNETAENESSEVEGEVNGSVEVNETNAGVEAEVSLGVQA